MLTLGQNFLGPRTHLLFQHIAIEFVKYKFLTVKPISLIGNISFRPSLTYKFGEELNRLKHTTIWQIYDPGVYSMPSSIPSFCANCSSFQEMTTTSSLEGETFIHNTEIQPPEERHSYIAIQQFYTSSIKIS